VKPSPIERVYETVVYANDLARTAGFYEQVLGLRKVSDIGELGVAFRLPDGGLLLLFDPELASQPGRPIPAHGAAGAGHLAFSVDDLQAWRDALDDAGVAVECETDWPRGGSSLYFRDPAGNSVELVAGEIWAS
jgi:catechol 2,3-dioxygenase-like lactoylglutathione lyase family enzyme